MLLLLWLIGRVGKPQTIHELIRNQGIGFGGFSVVAGVVLLTMEIADGAPVEDAFWEGIEEGRVLWGVLGAMSVLGASMLLLRSERDVG